jgi:hypothetical protein
MNFDVNETVIRYVRGKTYTIERECDIVSSNLMVNSIRYEILDNVWNRAQNTLYRDLTDTMCERIKDYSF